MTRNSRPLRVLVVEDNLNDAELMMQELQLAGFDPDWQRVATEMQYVDSLSPVFDVILADYTMPGFSGVRALQLLRERHLDVPFIIISGKIGEEIAVAAIELGATDYLLKDRLARLGPAVERAIEQRRLHRERAQADLALRESEERFRQLAENIQDVFWLIDLTNGRTLYISPAYEKIWGRTCAELYSARWTWLDAIHPDDRERVRGAVIAKQSAGTYDEEYRIVRPDGLSRWIRDRAFPVANAAGEIDRIAGVARDITEQKEAHEALQLFRDLVDQSNDTFEVIDPETGRFLDVNAKGPAELGCTRAEYLSWRVSDIDPTITPSTWPKVADAIRAAGSLTGEGRHRRKDGATFPIEFNAKWVDLDRGCIVAAIRNITERKRAEERIREQAAMLDHAHEAIMVCDPERRRITFWNQGAERLYGWTASEAEGCELGDLIFADPRASGAFTEVLLKSGEWRGEQKHLTRAGKRLTVSSHETLVRDEAGKPKSVLVINIDITGQKELEARFLRAQRMESIGTLASGVAHDLNNIMAPIKMFAPLLRRELTPEQREGIISGIESSAERGTQTIKQILTFGCGLEGEKRPLCIGALMEDLLQIIRGSFPKSIAIESMVEANLRRVTGDSTQLHQVLLNLCVNARDAMPDGGNLRLRASNVDVDASYASMLPEATPGLHVVLEVSDTGSGIPPDVMERMFEPFFTTKGVGKGTGLGLSAALGIVTSHGGFFNVRSELGKGTIFQVYLTAAAHQDAAPADTPPADPPPGGGELVLVVDDEPAVRDAARMVLESHGYRVLLAPDGPEAIAEFVHSANRIDVVLADLVMPHMEGVALIRALRQMKADVPIIASTGMGEKARPSELKGIGVEKMLYKPYSADTLLHTIHRALHPPASRRRSD